MEHLFQMTTGALAGLATGALFKAFYICLVGNAAIGAAGGAILGFMLARFSNERLKYSFYDMDMGDIITSLIQGGVGGGVALALVGIAAQLGRPSR